MFLNIKKPLKNKGKSHHGSDGGKMTVNLEESLENKGFSLFFNENGLMFLCEMLMKNIVILYSFNTKQDQNKTKINFFKAVSN